MPAICFTPQQGEYIVTDESGKRTYYGVGTSIDGITWAPINCGYEPSTATSKGYVWGKLYQWGRKYGQGYYDQLDGVGFRIDEEDETYPKKEDGTIVDEAVELNIGQHKNNKNIFYNGRDIYHHNQETWCNTTEHIFTLWNSGTSDAPLKSIYDPCPDGWRVPTAEEMRSLTTNFFNPYQNPNDYPDRTYNGQQGVWCTGSSIYSPTISSVFLPASGYNIYDCQGHHRRTGCYYHTSDITLDSDANYSNGLYHPRLMIYNLGNGSIGISSNFSSLSAGAAIRCVRE